MEKAPLLITGFEPFGGQTINASWEAVQLLPNQIDGYPVERLLLPVEFGASARLACQTIERLQPAAVIAVGEAGGRAHVTVERIAANLMQASQPDNAGFQPTGQPVVEGGPDALFATLQVDACVAAARAAGVPAEASTTAGLYVCNQLMYALLHHLAAAHQQIPAGFVHVPYVAQQVVDRPGVPFCSADLSAQALVAIAGAALC